MIFHRDEMPAYERRRPVTVSEWAAAVFDLDPDVTAVAVDNPEPGRVVFRVATGRGMVHDLAHATVLRENLIPLADELGWRPIGTILEVEPLTDQADALARDLTRKDHDDAA